MEISSARILNRYLPRALLYVGITLFAAIFSFPFYWMLNTALKLPEQIFTKTPQWFPNEITLENFAYLFAKTHFSTYLGNSVLIATVSTAISVVVSSLAAYACSRFTFRLRGVFLYGLLLSQMFPFVLVIIPIFVVVSSLQLLNNYLPVIVAYAAFSTPFSTWMLKGYFDSLPQELEEAAMVDGCTRVGALRHIVAPLAAPAIAAVSLFALIFGWQELIIALSLLRKAEMWTLPVGLSLFEGQFITLWGAMMAESVLFVLPLVLVFGYLEKYLVGGLMAGAVK